MLQVNSWLDGILPKPVVEEEEEEEDDDQQYADY